MITFDRKQTPIKVLDDDRHVGGIKPAAYGYMLELNDCYFAPDGRIRIGSGGTMVLGFKKLHEAKTRARDILSVVMLRERA